ncbi:uncharacterized protein PGTG_22608 [Puccinia graminis f. sp. tritici CRL 75-36-700-3]|uniref:Tyr recombinase domain-containing protein n=1 Tax=Puccinia graminis f. sp. tritici (strain CRL 75-36-700-3 / race SCCL) TaxID=418459 RepID=H6QV44_PUCGT|nr:uncharacterized protein PGTG_22608 [Puccinia graminis f. sp. tritici CRL 75-36-700-3]EHS62705.1 hypothetical protein PGTG_22608 [Puccinia graminis f. sp. tritici CRL 75-36-700-3]
MLRNRPPAFAKISHFLQNGSEPSAPSVASLHIISAWSWSTLLSYNSAVKKYLIYQSTRGTGAFTLPLTADDLEDFAIWAGRNEYSANAGKISAQSLKKYLIGLKAWHHFHAATYPVASKARIDLILKASSKLDAVTPKTPAKPPVMIWHLMLLMSSLHGKSDFDCAVVDLCIVAFWGLARLAELTYDKETGPLRYDNSALTTDVTFTTADNGPGELATISIRNAKTSGPGGTQLLLLTEQPHILCPVRAIRRRLREAGSARTSLFGFGTAAERRHLTRRAVVARIQEVLIAKGEARLLGHSFRVGGASLRHALGMPDADVRYLGRWTSRCYLLYLRPYSQPDLARTRLVLRNLALPNPELMGFVPEPPPFLLPPTEILPACTVALPGQARRSDTAPPNPSSHTGRGSSARQESFTRSSGASAPAGTSGESALVDCCWLSH